jgi:hypothetical protein
MRSTLSIPSVALAQIQRVERGAAFVDWLSDTPIDT